MSDIEDAVVEPMLWPKAGVIDIDALRLVKNASNVSKDAVRLIDADSAIPIP